MFYFEKLYIITIILILIIFFIFKYNNATLDVEQFLKKPQLFFKYLDQFYITNIYYTLFAVFCYIFMNFFIFIIIRYIFFNEILDINVYFLYNNFSYIMFFKTLCFLLCIIFYKYLLNILFYKEILKLHLFLELKSKNYKKLSQMIYIIDLKDFFGQIYLVLDNLSRLKVEPNEEEDSSTYFYAYSFVYDKIFIIKMSKFIIAVINIFPITRYIFIVLKYICYIFYRHLNRKGILKYLFSILLFIIFFYEFLNNQIHLTFYFFIVTYISNLLYNVYTFIETKVYFHDIILAQYFYANQIDYKKQRVQIISFANNISYEMQITLTNKIILERVNSNTLDFIQYILSDFSNKIDYTRKFQERQYMIKSIYYKYFIIIILFILNIYLLYNNNKYSIVIYNTHISLLLIIIPFIISLIVSLKIYQRPKEDAEEYIDYALYFESKKKYNVKFWLIIIIQMIFIIIFVGYANIIVFFDDNIIFDFWGITIKKIYTLEEKKRYFCWFLYYHLNYFRTFFELSEIYCFVDIIENIKNNITDKNTFKEIRDVIRHIIMNFYYIEKNNSTDNIKIIININGVLPFIIDNFIHKIIIPSILMHFLKNIRKFPIFRFIYKIIRYIFSLKIQN